MMVAFINACLLLRANSSFFDPESLIRSGGLLLIMLIIFAQTGMFFFFFLPGGALMFTAGVMAASGALHHDIFTVCVALIFACFAGTLAGYWFGRSTGVLLYERKDSAFFKKKHLTTAHAFFKKYGALALTIGLFFPVVRTFAPIVAGIIKYRFNRFLLLTFGGSVAWILAMILPGYLLGRIPFLKDYLTWIVASIIVVVTVPTVLKLIREFKSFRKDATEEENK